TGETSLLFRGGGRSSPGLFNPRDGSLLTRTEIEPISGGDFEQRVLVKNPASGEFEVHDNLTRKVSERHAVNIVGIDEETNKFYVLTDLFSDLVQAWMYDPAARKFDDEPLLAHPEFSIASLIPGTQPSNFNKVLGFVVDGPVREATYIEPTMAAIHAALKQAYPARTCGIADYNACPSRVLFTASDPENSPNYGVLLDRKQVVALCNQRPWIKPSLFGEQRWLTYVARDGLKFCATLDLP